MPELQEADVMVNYIYPDCETCKHKDDETRHHCVDCDNPPPTNYEEEPSK
jgi:hypothetical protein